jgi:polyhydroxyalkanoate synthesis regulator phasin
VRDALKSYLALAGGLTDVTRQRAVGAAKALVAQGEATAEQVSTLAEDLLAQSRSNRDAVTALVKYEVDRTLGRLGLAANDEVTELTKRIRSLEAQIRDLKAAEQATGAASRSAPTSSAASTTTASKSTRATAGKATGAKKAGPKKTAAKRPAAKRPAAKKTAAKKTAAKKTAAKKTAAKKTAAKKTAAKKTAARKVVATRPAARKTAKKTAKKTTRRGAR